MEKQKIKISDEQIESAIQTTQKNRYLYTLLLVSILFIQGLGGFTSISAIPLYFYETRYLCKEGQIFKDNCEKKFICSSSTHLNIDYILDNNNIINLTSFINRYELFCNNRKLSFLTTCFFIGGLIGTILYPFLYKYLGLLNTILSSCLLYIFSSILLYPSFNYIIASILYILNTLSLLIFLLGPPQYISEYSLPNERIYYFLIYFLSVPSSGLLSTLIAYKTHDIKYIFLISSIICLLGTITGKIYLVDSPRTCFIRNKYNDFISNCEYISKINESQIEFNLWKEKNIFIENKDNKEKRENSIKLINNFGNLDYITIWKLPSQVKLLILFCIVCFIANYGLLLVQLELKKQNNIFRTLTIAFCSDIIGFILGGLSYDIPFIKSKSIFIIINLLTSISYLLSSLYYNGHYIRIYIFMRICVYALLMNYNILNFEAFPTFTKSVAVSINRIFGRLFNLWTPVLMINAPRVGYNLGFFFTIINVVLTLAFSPEDTKNKVLKEYPKELIYNYNIHKNDDDNFIDNEETEKLKKENDEMK